MPTIGTAADMQFTAKIEQTFAYQKRMKYIAETDSFIAKDCDSLGFVKNVRQPYGWLKQSGTPPQPHLDVYIMTQRDFELGDEVEVRIIGVFWRADGDHKLVGVTLDRSISDFSELSDVEKEDMCRLYGGKYEGEGWFGKERAEEIITAFFEEFPQTTR